MRLAGTQSCSEVVRHFRAVVIPYPVGHEVVLPDGTVEWHEVKGFPTDVWILKHKLVLALFPETMYRVIR